MKTNDLYKAAQNIEPDPHMQTRLEAGLGAAKPMRFGWLRVLGMAAATCVLAALFAVPMMWMNQSGLFGGGDDPGISGTAQADEPFEPVVETPDPTPRVEGAWVKTEPAAPYQEHLRTLIGIPNARNEQLLAHAEAFYELDSLTFTHFPASVHPYEMRSLIGNLLRIGWITAEKDGVTHIIGTAFTYSGDVRGENWFRDIGWVSLFRNQTSFINYSENLFFSYWWFDVRMEVVELDGEEWECTVISSYLEDGPLSEPGVYTHKVSYLGEIFEIEMTLP
jgi:hypothetical protein